jgi:hypothetical protein
MVRRSKAEARVEVSEEVGPKPRLSARFHNAKLVKESNSVWLSSKPSNPTGDDFSMAVDAISASYVVDVASNTRSTIQNEETAKVES